MGRKNKKKGKKKPKVAKIQSAKAKRQRAAQVVTPTPNASMIHNLMTSEGVKGNFKDYVVIVGKRLVDWQGSYDMVRQEDGKTVGIPGGMALIHKSKLEPIVGPELAKHFWRPGIGRVYHGEK